MANANREALTTALAAAQAGDWHRAHAVVASHDSDPLACWLHAYLHKIEPDESNSRYWYARVPGLAYDSYADPARELAAIAHAIACRIPPAA